MIAIDTVNEIQYYSIVMLLLVFIILDSEHNKELICAFFTVIR